MSETYLLHLETATKVCSVALSRNGELRQIKESNDEEFSHGEQLTVYIEAILAREGISAKQLSGVSISSGPGSYTGLRIGVSVAKGLCYSLKIPLLAMDTLHALQQVAALTYPNQHIIPMIDARRMEVYTAVYQSDGNIQETVQAHIIEPGSFASYPQAVFVGDGAFKMKEQLSAEQRVDSAVLPSASGQVKYVWEKYQTGQFEDLAYFEPFYLKEFQFK